MMCMFTYILYTCVYVAHTLYMFGIVCCLWKRKKIVCDHECVYLTNLVLFPLLWLVSLLRWLWATCPRGKLHLLMTWAGTDHVDRCTQQWRTWIRWAGAVYAVCQLSHLTSSAHPDGHVLLWCLQPIVLSKVQFAFFICFVCSTEEGDGPTWWGSMQWHSCVYVVLQTVLYFHYSFSL